MREFMIFCLCGLVSAITAAPSYQYAAQMFDRLPHPQYGVAPTHSADFSNDLFTTHASNVEANFAQHSQSPLLAALHASYLTPAPIAVNSLQHQPHYQHTTSFEQQHLQHHHQQQQPQPHSQLNKPQTIISKRFYLHTAPEDDDDETEVKQHYLTIGKARKNYNIVFIKSPVKAKTRTSLKIKPAINEDKTVIYVLNKKHEAAEIDAQVYEPSTTTSKPEVYFIKYKTADEAAHAQHTIQAQYDALGGSSEIINEGVGLQRSVIGSLDAARHSATAVADTHDETQPLANTYSEEAEITQNTLDKQSDDEHSHELHNSDASNVYLPPVIYDRR